MEHTGHALRSNTILQACPLCSLQNILDERVTTAVLYAYLLHASERTIIDPWPAPRNMVPGTFMLVIDHFVIYTWSIPHAILAWAFGT